MNQTKQIRHLKVQQMLQKREDAMYEDLEGRAQEPNMHVRGTLVAVAIVAFLWYVVIATQMLEVITLMASV